jgi:S1-C subfamily serine protease
MTESVLLAVVPVSTVQGKSRLTNASGFFFERGDRLFLVTSLHVLSDEHSGHTPDRVEIDLHTDPDNLAVAGGFSIPLFRDGQRLWRQARDSAGGVDVAVIEIERDALPERVVLRAFGPQHLLDRPDAVEVGSAVRIVGFPLGFRDWLHHMPVVRQAIVASSFGLRFQGQGYFLTDGRTHRGSSGAPVVMRVAEPTPALGDLPWLLLGVHSGRLDVGVRDVEADEALGLNCAWYADILLTLTEPGPR